GRLAEPSSKCLALDVGSSPLRVEEVDDAGTGTGLAAEELTRKARTFAREASLPVEHDDGLAHVVEQSLQAAVDGDDALFALANGEAHEIERAPEAPDLVAPEVHELRLLAARKSPCRALELRERRDDRAPDDGDEQPGNHRGERECQPEDAPAHRRES